MRKQAIFRFFPGGDIFYNPAMPLSLLCGDMEDGTEITVHIHLRDKDM
jgi:hypothetical protein